MTLYATYKKGDQTNPNNLNIGMKEGMLVDWHDTDTMGPAPFSANHLKVFTVVKYPDAYKPDLIAACSEVPGDIIGGIPKRERLSYIDLKRLAQDVGDDSLYDKWAGPLSVDPIDYIAQTELRHRTLDSMVIDWTKQAVKLDLNLVYGGTHTIGSGGAYATVTAFKSDIGTLTSKIIGQLISAHSTTGITNFTHDASASKFETQITSNTPHNGVYGAGWTISNAHNSHCLAWNITNSGAVGIDNFTIKRTTAGSSFTVSAIISNNGALDGIHNINNMFIDGNSLLGSGILITPRPSVRNVYKCVFWDWSGTACYGIYAYADSTNFVTFESIALDNCQINVENNSGYSKYRNIYSANSITASSCFTGKTNGTYNTCGSTDATGTSGLTSLTHSNQVIATVDTDPDYLVTKAGGAIAAGGSTNVIAGNTSGMRGNVWASPPSVNAFQLVAALNRANLSGNFNANLLGGFQT